MERLRAECYERSDNNAVLRQEVQDIDGECLYIEDEVRKLQQRLSLLKSANAQEEQNIRHKEDEKKQKEQKIA